MKTRQYRYHLDKSSHKAVCPSCHRRRFVLYLDGDNKPLDAAVGRCDRQDNCGYHMSPSMFFRKNRETEGGGVTHSAGGFSNNSLSVPPRPDYIDDSIVRSTLRHYDRNCLVGWLWSRFSHLMSREAFDEVLQDYRVGTSSLWGGATVWWQIDSQGRARTGKVMAYDPSTGKRVKEPHSLMTWVHTLLKDRYPGFRMRQAYFGQHRIAMLPDATVWMAESEKAALIIALVLRAGGEYEHFVPVACGGCSGLDISYEAQNDPYNRIRSLYGRRVTLLPDQGQYANWAAKTEALEQYVDRVWISRNLDCDPDGVEVHAGDGPDDTLLRLLDTPDALWYRVLAL